MNNAIYLSVDFTETVDELRVDFRQSLKSELLLVGNQNSVVELTEASELPAGAMSAEAFTIGALVIAVLPSLLPTIIETIKDFKLRNNQHPIKIQVKKGDREIIVEIPVDVDHQKVEDMTDALLKRISSID